MVAEPASFPQTILVQVIVDGNGSPYIAAAANARDMPDDHNGARVARYMLVGTGSIQHSPRYVEDAKA